MISLAQADETTIDPAQINPNIPGSIPASQKNPDPAGLISNLYQYALLMGGLLAFVVVIWGGIEYTLSADNPSRKGDAKDRIKQALLGLLLLAGAFVVLNTINPKLTQLKLPTLKKITGKNVILPGIPPGTVGGICIQSTSTPAIPCNEGLICAPNNICVEPGSCFESANCSGLGQVCSAGNCIIPDGNCPAGLNPQSCNESMENNGGGYCNGGSCYSLGGPTGGGGGATKFGCTQNDSSQPTGYKLLCSNSNSCSDIIDTCSSSVCLPLLPSDITNCKN